MAFSSSSLAQRMSVTESPQVEYEWVPPLCSKCTSFGMCLHNVQRKKFARLKKLLLQSLMLTRPKRRALLMEILVSAGLGDAGNNEVPAIFEGKEQPAQIISDDGGDRVQGETSHSPVMQSQPEEVEPGKSAKQSNSVNGLRADAPNTDPVKKFRHLQFKLKLKGGVQSIC